MTPAVRRAGATTARPALARPSAADARPAADVPGARAVGAARWPAGPELARLEPEGPWSENAKVQFAWDLRDALAARIAGTPPSERSAAMRCLDAELARISTHQVDPRVAAEVLVALARALLPGSLRPSPDASADRILARSPAQLRVALAELRHPKTLATERVGGRSMKPNATAELGREIVAGLFDHAASGDLGAAARRLTAVVGVPPFVWGQLAEAVGAPSREAFFRELAAASPEELDDSARWLEARSAAFASMREALRLQAALPAAGAPGARASALARDPSSSPRLARALERQTEGLADLFGLAPADLTAELRARQRAACQALHAVVERAERALGAARAQEALARFDLEAEAAGLAALSRGVRVYTDLDAPEPMRGKSELLAARVAEAGLRLLAEDLRAKLAAEPRLAPLAAVLAASPRGALHVQEALVGVLGWALPPEAGERASQYGFRVAARLARPDGWQAVLDLLALEQARDRRGVVADLRDRLTASRALERGAAEANAYAGALQATLGEGRLPLARDAEAAIAAHMDACYPAEGMGYLATDGRAIYFFPVRNIYAGTEFGRDRGEDDPEDVGRLGEVLEALGLELLAKVHSHPDQSPVFSDTDLEGMRVPVVLAPELRTVIMGVSRGPSGELTHRLASFSSCPNGQVRAEDRLEIS